MQSNPDSAQYVEKYGSGKNRRRWQRENRKGRGKKAQKKRKDEIPPPGGDVK